jgi:hypothetical protein
VSAETPASAASEYSLRVGESEQGWVVEILVPGGAVGFSRPCSGEVEARTFASTVRQHLYWLSPDKFREYYRLEA